MFDAFLSLNYFSIIGSKIIYIFSQVADNLGDLCDFLFCVTELWRFFCKLLEGSLKPYSVIWTFICLLKDGG